MVLLFCPACSNVLTVSNTPARDTEYDRGRQNRFECRTCPYQFVMKKAYFERKHMKRKEVEDVMGGAQAWENVDKTEVQCANEKCDNSQAFFFQLQIRSADEPMTSFFKCTKCGKQWRE